MSNRRLIVAGASAYARIIDFKKFREIADEVGAVSDGRYGTYRRTCGSRTSSKPNPVCRCDNNHNTQNTAWTKRRYDPLRAKKQQRNLTLTKLFSLASRADR